MRFRPCLYSMTKTKEGDFWSFENFSSHPEIFILEGGEGLKILANKPNRRRGAQVKLTSSLTFTSCHFGQDGEHNCKFHNWFSYTLTWKNRNQKPVIVISILQQIRKIPVPQYSYITKYNLRLLVAGKCFYKILH